MPIPLLPIIPLGVHSSDFILAEGERQAARRALGINDDEIVLLYVGRLAFHAKAHHVPMLLAAEEAAQGYNVALLQAGWFANDKVEAIYRNEGADFAPSLRRLFLDGRKPKELRMAWAAGDVFTSLAASEIGPDLGQPKAATDYMTEPGLRALVRDPKSVRTWSQQQMPAFPPNLLPDTELNALITYLNHIASQRGR